MSRTGGIVPFYEEAMPKAGAVVFAKVRQVNDTSATVELLEYANHEGMIPYTEFTRLRIRAVGKVIKVGRMEAVQVLRMDAERGYIDLSKKQVTRDEAKRCEEYYYKSRDVTSIVCHVADECNIARLDAMKLIAYPLYKRTAGKHAKEWFELALTDPEEAFGCLKLPGDIGEKLQREIHRRLKVQPVKIRADLEVTCFTREGVDAVRDVLRLGIAEGSKGATQLPVIVSIIAPPQYIIHTQTERREEGLKKLHDAIETMTKEMNRRGGSVKILNPPAIVGEDEDKAQAKPADDESQHTWEEED